MRVSLALVIVMLTAGLAGCIGSDEAARPSAAPASSNASLALGDPVSPITECTINCKEPTVAVDLEGRIFVAEHLTHNDTGQPAVQQADETGTGIVRSTDGGETWERLGSPSEPGPVPPGTCQGDSLVQTGPEGSLYYSSLLFQCYVGVQAVHGIQIARSDDGGETWATNTIVSVTNDPRHGTIQPDRQWLAFGDDGRVYLTYTHLSCVPPGTCAPTGVFIHRSDDRGASWSGPSVVATDAERAVPLAIRTGQVGAPVVDETGRIFVPMSWGSTENGTPSAVRVAVSTDGGESWTTHEALRAAGAGSYFPFLTLDGTGHLHLATLSEQGLLVATSQDGAETWSTPQAWAEGIGFAAAPWIAAAERNLTVAYFNETEDALALELAQRPLDAEPGSGPTQRVTVAEGLPSAHTDFAHFIKGPDGPWVTWGDADAEEVRLVGPGSTPTGSR